MKRVLHKGPADNRLTKVVEHDSPEHAKALKAGWSETPEPWDERAADEAKPEGVDPAHHAGDDSDDADKRPIPAKAPAKAKGGKKK